MSHLYVLVYKYLYMGRTEVVIIRYIAQKKCSTGPSIMVQLKPDHVTHLESSALYIVHVTHDYNYHV